MRARLWLLRVRELFTGQDRKHDLSYILAAARPAMPPSEGLEWMAMLSAWLTAPVADGQRSPATRLRFILQLLERHPEWTAQVGELLGGMFQNVDAFGCFTHMGLFEEKGLIDQFVGVALERTLPLPLEPHHLEEWFDKVFPRRDDAEWVEQLPVSLIQDWLKLLAGGEEASIFAGFQRDMLRAMDVLALEIAAMGMSPSLWIRIGSPVPEESAFWKLSLEVQALTRDLRESGISRLSHTGLQAARTEWEAATAATHQTFAYLETNGVNSGLVMRMEHLLMHLRRLGFFFDQLEAALVGKSEEQAMRLLSELIRARYDSHNLRQLLRNNVKMLSLRVVEHTGSSGEHYITRNRAEYFSMLRSASGGGVLTVGTTLLKFLVGTLALPAFVEALFNWVNYAGSFLLMQGLHFTLATKQPSMTASTLATKIKQSEGTGGLAIGLEIRNIVRSQFAAALGNIGLAVPTALVFSLLFAHLYGHPLFDAGYAQHSIESLNPIKTLTLIYAAETGVLLWLSSLVAGWFENWLAFQRVPERIARNFRLRRAFGPGAGASVSDFLSRNISGITGNIVLGFCLALVPFLGKITGLPLDVRHVTLSSASLAISAFSLGAHVDAAEVFAAAIGCLIIGILNFGVSFYLALSIARYAQSIDKRRFKPIRYRLGQLFRWQPTAFFYPVASIEEEQGLLAAERKGRER